MAAFISYSKWNKGTTKAKVPHKQTIEHSKYKQWDEEQMVYAVKAVTDGLSIRRAAEEYGVPRSTLGDRISGCVIPGSTSGPPKYLSNQEEEELVQFLMDCASIGYPRGRLEVIAMIQCVYVMNVVMEGLLLMAGGSHLLSSSRCCTSSSCSFIIIQS